MTSQTLHAVPSPATGQRIACIGECMIEIQQNSGQSIYQRYAGDTLNTAVYLSRLLTNSKHQVSYVTALGDDRFSLEMQKQWAQEGINCALVRTMEGQLPGLYYVETDANGERSFHYWRSQSAAKKLLEGTEFDERLESLIQYDYLYLSGISLAILSPEHRTKLIGILQRAKNNGKVICFDNNYRPALWQTREEARDWYMQVLALTDIAFLTEEDEFFLWQNDSTDEALIRYEDLGISELVLKRGAEPCIVLTPTEHVIVPARRIPPADIIDTNAAGDSFNAAYLEQRLKCDNPRACATAGHALASTVIQHTGAIIPKTVMSCG